MSSCNGIFRKVTPLLMGGLLLGGLSACGGSGGQSSNNTPELLVDAGTAQTIALPAILSLDATVTEDGQPPPAGSVSYSWTQVSGPGVVGFTDASAEDTTATFSLVGSYVLGLSAENGSTTANDLVEITVNQLASGASGLASRPANSTECIAPAVPPVASAIQLEAPFPNLPILNRPVAMLMAPGDATQWYVVQQPGQVVRFENSAAVNSVNTYIDISDRVIFSGEMGLLGMAFHPDYANNGFVYLSYTNETSGRVSRISRFSLNGTGTALDPATEQIILSLPQPFTNHNGGQISFGPDGYLYIGFGDGGSGGDPQGHGQDLSTWLGAMLRIDVDGASPYAVPPDNPFSGSSCNQDLRTGQCPEIFAYGLRNPWRWSFDQLNGDLWLGDVGQGTLEEIDLITSGGNYGWNVMEGSDCFNAVTCDQTGLVLPVVDYPRTEGTAVTGGYVYRGSAISFIQGQYLYGDFSSGKIWRLEQTGPGQYTSTELLDSSLNIASFAEDHAGELYVVHLGGTLHKIIGDNGGQTGQIPTQLSDWGCFQVGDASRFSEHVIPYDINALLWSDNADKERFMALPDGTTIDVDIEGRFVFPVGSVLGKNFRLNSQLIETRLFMHHQPPHGWKGYTYEWNDSETEASLLTGAKERDVNGQIWHYPSRAECDACHTAVVGFTLGPEIAQLNRSFVYPSPGSEANQLITLESISFLTAALSEEQKSTAFYSIDNTAYSAERRARSYLHANCANCHQLGGPGGGNMDLRMATPLEDMRICNQTPLGDTLGQSIPVLVAPGDPDNSILVMRMESTGTIRMPPLATSIVDTQALAVIREWISQLSSCP